MKKKTIKITLGDIIEFSTKIERYIKGLTRELFEQKEMVIDAVLRNLELIGEASKNLSEDFKKQYAIIPWKKIIGLRNIVIHAYSNVDLDIIWDIITINIPETKVIIKKIYEEMLEKED